MKKDDIVKCSKSDCFGYKDGICKVLRKKFGDSPDWACTFFQEREALRVKEIELYGEPIKREWC